MRDHMPFRARASAAGLAAAAFAVLSGCNTKTRQELTVGYLPVT